MVAIWLAAMLVAWAGEGGPTVRLAEGSALTQAQAQAFSPASLGGALLAPPHPAIVRSVLHPLGMEGISKSLSAVELIAEPRPAAEPGFCSADIFRVSFPSSFHAVVEEDVALKAEGVQTTQHYRVKAADGCGGPDAVTFAIAEGMKERQLLAVKLLENAQKSASRAWPLPFRLVGGYADDQHRPLATRANLRALKLDQIVYVVASRYWSLPERARQARIAETPDDQIADTAGIGFAGGLEVEMALRGDVLLSISFSRPRPPVF